MGEGGSVGHGGGGRRWQVDEGDRRLVAAIPDHPVAEADILVRDLHDVHQTGLKKSKAFCRVVGFLEGG